MTNSRNPNKGHYNPPPTVTHGTKAPKPVDRSDAGKASKAGGSR